MPASVVVARLRLRLAPIVLLIVACSAPAGAQEAWKAGTSSWFTGTNWTPTGPPTSATTVTVGNGGTAIIGAPNAQSSNATIDAGSTIHVESTGDWTLTGGFGSSSMIVGDFGVGALTIDTGGTLTTTGSIQGGIEIGYLGGSNGTVTVGNGGTGTALLTTTSTGTADLDVGNLGTGALNVNKGGSVTGFDGIDIGVSGGGVGTVTVNGGSVSVTPFGVIFVGDSGVGALLIEGGGSVSSTTGVVAFNTGSGTSSVTVTGANSVWNVGTGGLNVGTRDTGSVTISNGGTINVATNGQIYIGSTNSGVSGNGSLTVNGGTLGAAGAQLFIGANGSGTGSMLVENGGVVTTSFGWVGGALVGEAASGSVTVTGAGSTWNVGDDDFFIGNNVSGTAVDVVSAGQLTSGFAVIGIAGPAGVNSNLTVDGLGSSWSAVSEIVVGYYQPYAPGQTAASTGSLTISGGATASNYATIVGLGMDTGGTPATTDTLLVTGAGSKLTLTPSGGFSGALVAGYFGTALVTISDGGEIDSDHGTIGYSSNAAGDWDANAPAMNSNGTVVVTGAGSSWKMTNNLIVGDNAGGANQEFAAAYTQGVGTATGTLNVLNGGAVSDAIGIIGMNAGATGFVTVDGAGSSWSNSTDILVGDHGVGTLTISNGGQVSSAGAIGVAALAGSMGTINIGAAKGQSAVAPGALLAPEILFGAGAGSLVFNHTSADYAFNASIQGAGSVDVESGVTALTGASGYTGPTTVNGGVLEVDGSINGSDGVIVNSGATLRGTGLVGSTKATVIESGATLAPGAAASPGTSMRLQGTLVFGSTSANYSIYLNPSATTFATVNGAASLAGTVNATFAPGAYVSKQYTILATTGGLGGTTFSSLNTVGMANLPAGATDSLSYSADDVFLNLAAGFSNVTGLNTNQQNVANALTGYFNRNGSIPAAFFGLSPDGLSQVDGEAATGAALGAFQFTNSFLSLMLDPYAENRGGGLGGEGGFGPALGYAGDAAPQTPPAIGSAFQALAKDPALTAALNQPHWSLWGAAFGGAEQTSGNATIGSHSASSGAAGFAAGADYHVAPDAMLGFALAGGGASWSLADGFGGGRSSVFQAGLYGAKEFGPAYVSGALAAGDYLVSTSRTAMLAGGDVFTANYNAQGFGARLESGYHLPFAPLTLTPYAALQAQAFETPAYRESAVNGATLFALNYASQSATETRFELGASADKTIAFADGDAVKLFGRLAFAHDWQSNPEMTATFLSLPTASFVVNGAREAPDLALVTAGVEWRIARNWTLSAKFDGEFGAGSQTYGATGRIGYVW